MKKRLRILLILAGSMLLAGALAYGGLQLFVRAVVNHRDCEWANIDNVEIHAGLDIPDITGSDCYYDKVRNVKMARFDINKKKVDLARYIRLNQISPLGKAEPSFARSGFLDPEHQISHAAGQGQSLYYHQYSFRDESSQAVLDTTSGKLWVTIYFAD